MSRVTGDNLAGIGWTASQRRALLLLLSILLIALAVRFVLNRQYVSDPQPPQGARYHELASRLDPNSADWQSLATIPSLGEKRARQIVAYRDQLAAQNGGAAVFRRPSDLLRIRGIGRATVENLKPYLKFDADN